MGFFELFQNNRPNEKRIAKQIERLKEPYAKTEYRQSAMDQLFKWGTGECFAALLHRFKIVSQSLYWDEREKLWLTDEFVKRSKLTKKVLENFVTSKNENEIIYPILALKRICAESEFVEIIKQALSVRNPEDHRSTIAKLELISTLEACESLSSAELIESIQPYLRDLHDDVKCNVINIFMTQKIIKDAHLLVIDIITDDSFSERVLRHAAFQICKFNLRIPNNTLLVINLMKEFRIESGKLIQRIGSLNF